MEPFVYKGAKANQISFPLGGIGSGCIGLAGNGRLIDWEIFNRPNKGSVNGFSHFAVRAQRGTGENAQVVDARVLNGPLAPPYQGEVHVTRFQSFGWGPRREYLTGLPHFEDTTFTGKYPLAEIDFADKRFPGKVKLLAFNPMIPLNDRESSIPAAFFEFSITNTTKETLTYTLAGVLCNPLPANNSNEVVNGAWGTALHLTSDGVTPGTPAYGDLTLATDAGAGADAALSWQQYWFRGIWFDSLEVYWKDFTTPGALKNRTYPREKAGSNNEGLLAAHITLAPGATRRLRYVIAWSFPTCENYWKRDQLVEAGIDPTWTNYYATQWENSLASAEYALAHWDRLLAETRLFQETLFNSTLPVAAIDAIAGNMAILKSPTVLRLTDGTFYGWEGLHPTEGCCEGSCTHVWNYQQTLPFLYPALERSMRTADYKYNLRPDGGMPFRIQLPLGAGQWDFRACADGQLGGVLKTYRDWKVSGDSVWLAELWPAVKASLEFAWHPGNEDRWDPEMTGVLWGRQHHTLDMELFGPNAWLTGMYLGALKAGAEMADHLGDIGAADHYRAMFARGKAWADANLFNGEYYVQRIDLHDKSIVEDFAKDESVLMGGSTMDAYWDEEHQEIKYQIGEGSSIDQVLGQWHASLYGLGEIFDPQKVRQANAAIYKYNYIPLMGAVYNPCRIYCLNDEGGLVICAWPEGSQKPTIPAPYSQETMNGFEYSAAIHMIMTGQVDEGMECIAAIRQRYDGERRNPWNEFECGSNYARSMAAYALLNAFSGFRFDMVAGRVGFQPIRSEKGKFQAFWSLAPAWGEVRIEKKRAELRVLRGALPLHELELPLGKGKVKSVKLGGEEVAYQQAGDTVRFAGGVTVPTGAALAVAW
jgi:uncharacterized protein (DUF608 family)